jgi:general L-amino acid transport system substrate-binding protein
LVLFFKKELLLLFLVAASPLRCGVIAERDDWNKVDQHGDLSVFEAEICRAMGDAAPARFGQEEDGLRAVHAGDVDVVVGVTPRPSAAARDHVRFGAVIFYDAIAVMARSAGTVCAAEGSDAEALLSRPPFSQSGATVFSFQEEGEMESALLGGRCAGVAATMSRLGRIRSIYGARLAGARILPQRLGMVTMAAAYRADDIAHGAVADWTIQALLQAEAVGVTGASARSWRDDGNVVAERLMGVSGDAGGARGLKPDWAVRVVSSVGNYGEIFARTVGGARGENALWTQGGLMVPGDVQ